MRRFALAFIVTVCAGFATLSSAPAHAQLARGSLRLFVDADMLAVAGVHVGGGKETVVSFGPNQLGGTLVYGGPTPLGWGLDYAITNKVMLGGRMALGYDVISPDGAHNNTRNLGIALMPELRIVPLGDKAKLFILASPIFQVGRSRTDPNTDHTIVGGFGVGVGTFIFVTNSFSVDLGVHFEGRWGSEKHGDDPNKPSVQDLRGLFRIGVSYWT